MIRADMLLEVAKSLGIDTDNLRRIVIDLPYDDVPIIYIEQIGDNRIVEIDWGKYMTEVRIKKVSKRSKDQG